MGFFSDLFKEDKRKELRDLKLRKAAAIAMKIGEQTFHGSGIGSHYDDYEYSGHSLFIKTSTKGTITPVGTEVYFCGDKVLSDSIYEEGIWEELLDEIYLSIKSELKERKQKQEFEERKENLRKKLSDYNGEIDFGYGVSAVVDRIEKPYSSYDTIVIHVYDLREEVFYSNDLTIMKYIPGDWEQVIDEYEEYQAIARKEEARRRAEQDIVNLRRKRSN